MDEEHKRRISETLKGRKFTDEHKRKISEAHKGKIFSEETLERMRQSHKGQIRGPVSDETRAKIGAAHRGRKHSPEHIEKHRQAMLGKPGTRNGAHHTEEAKQKLREARANQVHPRLAARGITIEQLNEAEAKGQRWCGGDCKAFLPNDQFYKNGKKCKVCAQSSNAKFRHARTEEERAQVAANMKDYRITNSGAVRRKWLERKYKVTPEWYDEKLAEQDGHCALCDAIVDGRKLPEQCYVDERQYLLVDHDHENGKVRGLLCAKCNTALNRVEYVKEWAAKALTYLARYAEEHSIPAPLAVESTV